MVNEMNYETLLFMGRDLKKKGTAAFGEWKLFQAKFNNAEDKTLKFSAFSNPKIGLSIEDLKEGESYTVGYTSEQKEFTGSEGNLVQYEARTIKFLDEPKDKQTSISDEPTPDDTSEPDTGSDLNDYQPTEQELVWLNKLKALDSSCVTEDAFYETMKVRGRTHDDSDTHLSVLWAWFNKK